MGTTAAAARRCLLSAHQDLEGIERPKLRGQKNAVLDLYEQCPENGAVICFDECGPLELRPLAGKGWFRSGHPQRFRATYRRLQGTEQLLAFYDVHADCLVGQVRKHKRVDDLLAVFARLRACYPMDVRLSVVMDNLNTHKHARLKAFMAAHNIEPASTPTDSSWLNAIEAHCTSLKKFAIGGTDDPSHEYRRWRIARYLTWRNKEKGSSKAALAQFSRVKLYRH